MQGVGGRRSRRAPIASPTPQKGGHPILARPSTIRRRLLGWYDANHRKLPWRDLDPPDEYATLVSETMLQQTQVATVIPYYLRFMERFPTVEALAAARIDDVLPYWAGLGYYRRCHNLHAASLQVVHDYAGAFPRNVDGLLRLPGVGRYTAGAVASIAFNVAAPAVDGNVRRVLSRVLGLPERSSAPAHLAEIEALATAWIAPRRPADFNQALMELGALVCTPRLAHCTACPLRAACAFDLERDRRGPDVRRDPALRPAALTRKPAKRLDLVTVAIEHRGRLLYRRRPNDGLWAGLWEWPTEPVERGESGRDVAERIMRRLSQSQTVPARPFHTLVHVLTHRRVRFRAYHVLVKQAPRRRPGERSLRRGAESHLPMSRAQEKLLERL